MKSFSEKFNIDPVFGLISYKGSDGSYEQGDTCANVYTLAYCGTTLPGHVLLYSPDGWPRRSPDTSKWYGRPKRCSRDQLTPVLVYTASQPTEHLRFWNLLKVCARHCFLFANNTIRNHVYEDHAEHLAKSTPDVAWNPKPKLADIMGPDMWQIFLRGVLRHYSPRLYPVAYVALCILDLHGLLSAAFTRTQQLLRLQVDHDQRNQALKTHFAAHIMPTIVSKLAYRLYQSCNPTQYFVSWWTQPGEPALHEPMCKLYKQ